jgi:hypothetical protein
MNPTEILVLTVAAVAKLAALGLSLDEIQAVLTLAD